MGTRLICVAAVALCLRAGVASSAHAAEHILTSARESLGGEDSLARIRSVRAEGRSARIVGPLRLNSLVTLELQRPDRYIRTDRVSIAGISGYMTLGFNAGALIQRRSGPDDARLNVSTEASAGSPSSVAAADGIHRELRLLLLGFFADAFDGSVRESEPAGVAEAPDGKADAVRLAFADGSTATLYVDVVTRRPLMVSWDAPDALAGSLANPVTPGSVTGHVTTADGDRSERRLIDHRFYFADYRRVGDLHWPFLIRRSAGGVTHEELRLDKITANPRFDPDTFAVR